MLSLMSWNCKDNVAVLKEQVIKRRYDVVFLAEAHSEERSESSNVQEAVSSFEGAGYAVYREPYDDVDGRVDRHYMMMLVRKDINHKVETLWLESRNAIKVDLSDKDLSVVGVHLDDRSEASRFSQAASLLSQIDTEVVVVGDFNAAPRGNRLGYLLKFASPLVSVMPVGEPGRVQSKIARLGSLLTRLTLMANSQVLEQFYEQGFFQSDTKELPTMLFGGRAVVKLDHALARTYRKVLSYPLKVKGSDHLPLRIEVE